MNYNLIDSGIRVFKCPVSELEGLIEEFIENKKIYKGEIWKVLSCEYLDNSTRKTLSKLGIHKEEPVVTAVVHFVCNEKMNIIMHEEYLLTVDKKYRNHLLYIRKSLLNEFSDVALVYIFGVPVDLYSVRCIKDRFTHTVRAVPKHELWSGDKSLEEQVREILEKTRPHMATRFKVITEYLLQSIEILLNSNEKIIIKDI